MILHYVRYTVYGMMRADASAQSPGPVHRCKKQKQTIANTSCCNTYERIRFKMERVDKFGIWPSLVSTHARWQIEYKIQVWYLYLLMRDVENHQTCQHATS